MGLTLQVGLLADLVVDDDEEGLAYWQGQFDAVNRALAGRGLAPRVEPREGASSSYDMFGYAGLHHLRRAAVHLWAGEPLPPPADRDNYRPPDPLQQEYAARDGVPPTGLFGWLRKERPRTVRFDHLLLHADHTGFYLPIDFEKVIFPPDGLEIPGHMIGSVPRLLGECAYLSSALDIPDGLEGESDEVMEALDEHGEGEGWRAHAIETFTCLQLMAACRDSMRTGAALVFC
jgi:hypothetical protein